MLKPLSARQKRVGKYILRLVHAPTEHREAYIIVLAPVTRSWQGKGPLSSRVVINGITYWDVVAASYRFYADALREYENSTSETRLKRIMDFK